MNTSRLFRNLIENIDDSMTELDVLASATREICIYMGWPIGHVYLPSDRDPERLVPSGRWYLENPDKFEEFRSNTNKTELSVRDGLVGNAYINIHPEFVENLACLSSYARAAVAGDANIGFGCALPVVVRSGVSAVLEFYASSRADMGDVSADVMSSVGYLLGTVIERHRTSHSLHKSEDMISEYKQVLSTVRKVLQEKSHQFASNQDALVAQVMQRTDELVEAQERAQASLREKEMAVGANRAKSGFLSSMNHELRTPMNAILGYAQLLNHETSEPLSPSQGEFVNEILQSGRHMLELINDVLDLAKIESGHLSFETGDHDVVEIISACLGMIDANAKESGIRIVNQLPTNGLPIIRGDSLRLRQVFLNLLSNAVKYNRPDGQILLECDTVMEGYLRVSISDTGEGIPEELWDKVFEPYDRLGADSTGIQGTGIGLTVTKQLIEGMRGSIGFSSIVGKGTTFWIDLPIAEKTALSSVNELESQERSSVRQAQDA